MMTIVKLANALSRAKVRKIHKLMRDLYPDREMRIAAFASEAATEAEKYYFNQGRVLARLSVTVEPDDSYYVELEDTTSE